MPIRYICRKCGHVLWSFTHVGQDYFGVPTPDEIKRMYGVCPSCKREFIKPSLEDIILEPISKKLVKQTGVLDILDTSKTFKTGEGTIVS